jgi:O-antigen ligase
MALYSIPFGVLVHNITTNRRMKFAMRMLLALSGLSILFSGTRGALVGLTFILMIYLGRWVLRPGVLISLGLLLSVGYALLPEEYKHRYSLILIDDETELETASDVDAAESAQGRIEGLVDGWHLLLKRPVTGYGPGVSALARLEVRERPPVEDSLLQLHNLYGQIMAELGVPGSLLFIGMIVVYFRKLTRAKIFAGMPGSQESDLAEFIKALRMLMLILLFYGLFTHSLYRYYWMLLFACHNILVNVVGEGRNLTARRAGAAPHSGSRH